ncbi:TPA_asm: hypothetical protein G1X19_10890 [Salmonella enterica subsp. enterica serovar Typhimurium str. SL1344]|uniref:Uncharacterized protein n=1 Tax=Salmonella typhimurium (strain SL1344) TaxID=216597 RepID=A0A718W916_SALTS|nr:hypothetical protein [Salmonella enterica]HAD6674437.1 hypothetical protein [Salmonella enterica subsp. enterica serovar Typhimurium str. SL1344]HAD6692701.1 hypothetical protein [Salmonella enterica subsp. enterica serovar Typhimurium str. SL1344]HAD6716150.1 hypothetical protein [Salmonella enterica subsp. enterica serovar Typhimurium str. SL1344]
MVPPEHTSIAIGGQDEDRFITGINNFIFRMRAAGVLSHVQHGQEAYASVYDDLKTNGLPGKAQIMKTEQTAGILQEMFGGEGPTWLQTMAVSDTTGLSRFSDASLRQVEGVYGALIVAGSGELHLSGEIPERWQVSLPVCIEHQ